jgi:membrane protein DedA with SNARE-associated domain
VVLASITDPLVRFAVNVINDLGLPGVFLLMTAESACLPIPSEGTMLFAGFNVASGDWSLWEITVVGVLGNLLGSWIAYAVGYFGRVDLIEKHGRKVLIKPHHLKWADDWFARYGDATVFFSRLLPIIRTFISLPAGVAKMPFWRFTLFTVLGSIPWVFALGLVGREAGSHWERWKEHLHYVDYVVIAGILLGVAWLVVRYVRRRRASAAAVDAA